MTFGVATRGWVVKFNRRFLEDAKRLPRDIRTKVDNVVRNIREQGAYYSGLETRKLAGNPHSAFKIMDVDYTYRIIAAIEGPYVFLEKVGLHDPTERWGTTATLRPYEQRIRTYLDSLGPSRRPREVTEPVPSTEVMFDLGGPTLAEIAASPAMSDVLTDSVDGVLDGWANGTIEDWMVFLSPVQRRAVERGVGGPARVTGGPGTGKSVVGLHRAVEFAREMLPDQRILMTSFVRTVPDVLSGLYERLAPELADRADFLTVHQLARRSFDGDLGVRLDDNGAKSRFERVLVSKPDRWRQLQQGARFGPEYLWEEITRVIQGRGIESRAAYLGVNRHGRRRAMPAMIRALVWDIYEEYRAACQQGEAVADWNRLLTMALERVRDVGPKRRYAAIVVDEAQDITEVGVRLLVEHLEGGAAGRLLLVGDSGQRIYPGGYRLGEIGLEVRGRSFALSVSYRSTDEIMQAVGSLGRFLSPEEFGEDGLRALSMNTVRSGPRPTLRSFRTPGDEAAWIIGQLDPDDPDIDGTAIFVFTNREVAEWRRRLADAGIGTVGLEDYRGRPVPGVKVGTYYRAKGLEFARVFLPCVDEGYPSGDHSDADEIVEKGAALYVAMSRARDHLLISYAGQPSMFLEPVMQFCEAGEGPG